MPITHEADKPTPKQIQYVADIHNLAPADENAPDQTILRGRCGQGFSMVLAILTAHKLQQQPGAERSIAGYHAAFHQLFSKPPCEGLHISIPFPTWEVI